MQYKKLTWGVKRSFREYVEAAGGTIDISEGVSRNDSGEFVFEAQTGGNFSVSLRGDASGSTIFRGSVEFVAHGGMLKATIAELGVESGPEGAVLTMLEGPANENRCVVAKLIPLLDSSSESVTFNSEITLDGMFQIADNYPPGTEMDPVSLE